MQLKEKTKTIPFRQKSESLKTSKLIFLVVIAIAASGAGLLVSIVTLFSVWGLSLKPVPTMVQLENGTTVKVDHKSPTYRSPATIQTYVQQTLYSLMTMTSFSANEQRPALLNDARQLAEPVIISYEGKTGRITQSAWIASQTLEPKFAESFRWKLAEITSRDVFDGKEEVILNLTYVKAPVEVKNAKGGWSGRWDVDVVGDLTVFRRDNGLIKTVPFNKKVTVRAIATPKILNIDEFGPLAASINQINQSGLQIENIRDLSVVDVF